MKTAAPEAGGRNFLGEPSALRQKLVLLFELDEARLRLGDHFLQVANLCILGGGMGILGGIVRSCF